MRDGMAILVVLPSTQGNYQGCTCRATKRPHPICDSAA